MFRRGQLISAAAYSLGHGTNDAQKTMGIIAGALFTVPQYRYLVSDAVGKLAIPFWIVLLAHAAIGLGTLSGGWRIVHTMGSRITRLQPIGGFAAEAAGAITLFRRGSFRHPGFDHAYNHWRDRRRRLIAPASLGALECCRKNRLGVDLDDTGVGVDRDVMLVDARFRDERFSALKVENVRRLTNGSLNFSPSFQALSQSYGIGVFKIAAHGQAARDARD